MDLSHIDIQTIITLAIAALGVVAAILQKLGKSKLAAEVNAVKGELDDHKDQLDALASSITVIVKGVEASKGKIDDQTIQTILAQIKERAPGLVGNEDLVKSIVMAITSGRGDVKTILAQNS